MTTTLRRAVALVSMVRPAAAITLVLVATLGMSLGGSAADHLTTVRVLAAAVGYLLFAVALNDINDVAVDRINLPRRPLVSGRASRTDVLTVGTTGGIISLASAASLGWRPLLVQAVGLLVAVAYSVRPVRLCDRGAAGTLVLPLAYVIVPYLVGALAGRAAVNLPVLVGISLGFTGRILLKDFRDELGDTLCGKRTVLVRHGRRTTCRLSTVCWTAGGLLLITHGLRDLFLLPGEAGALVAGILLIQKLTTSPDAKRDRAIIATLAILGRSLIMAMVLALMPVPPVWLLGWTLLVALQAMRMYAMGPITVEVQRRMSRRRVSEATAPPSDSAAMTAAVWAG